MCNKSRLIVLKKLVRKLTSVSIVTLTLLLIVNMTTHQNTTISYIPEQSYSLADESIQVTTTGTGIRAPHITKTIAGGYYIAWAVPGDIYITNSSDGTTWATPRLAESSGLWEMHGADICQTSDGSFWIAARRNNGGDEEIYILNSTDGVSWSSPAVIVDTTSLDSWPRITAASDDTLLVMFTHGGTQVQMVSSADGVSWTSPSTISSGKWGDIHTATDGTIYACYESGGDIYVKHSDDGVTWSSGIEIMSVYPSFGGSLTDMDNGSVLCLAGAQGTNQLYMCRANDGESWSSPVQVFNDPDGVDYPDITFANGFSMISHLDSDDLWIRTVNMSAQTFDYPAATTTTTTTTETTTTDSSTTTEPTSTTTTTTTSTNQATGTGSILNFLIQNPVIFAALISGTLGIIAAIIKRQKDG